MSVKKVLLIGDSYSLSKYIYELGFELFVVSGCKEVQKFAACVDIREDKPLELLEFVLENEIDLTIVISYLSLKSGIVSMFQSNDRLIFAPNNECAELVLSKSAAQKFFYKNRIPTVKFGVFEKSQPALDYLKNIAYPVVISSDMIDSAKILCTSFERAKYYVEDLFIKGESKIVIDEYAYGTPFSLYALSDGYNILPIAASKIFEFDSNGDSGFFTSGVASYVPFQALQSNTFNKIFSEVILKVSEIFRDKNNPYVGIIGVDGVLQKDEFKILNFRPFFRQIDSCAMLNTMDNNFVKLAESCANGSFSDEYDELLINDNVFVSCLFRSKNGDFVILDEEYIDSEISYCKSDIILISGARTFSRAKAILKSDSDKFDKTKFRFRSDTFEC